MSNKILLEIKNFKQFFLNKLKNKNEKYKRYNDFVLCYGGESIKIVTVKIELEVKVFDIFLNFWKICLKKPKKLYNELLKLESYSDIKKEKILDLLILARDYFLNFNFSYGPGFLGSSIYENKIKYIKFIEKIRDFDVKNLIVDCKNF